MAETANIALIASKIANEIFKVFHWETHPQKDSNFDCALDHHLTEKDKKKNSHPADVVFHYFDPYLKRRVHFHTDLKSYAKSTIQQKKIRSALQSLAMASECAGISPQWQQKFVLDDKEHREVRGLLLVANHDNKATGQFDKYLRGIDLSKLGIAKGQQLHVLGPTQLTDLYTIATDIRLLMQGKEISTRYRFHYPDLTLWKRQMADDERSAATIESLRSPFFILKHDAVKEDQDQSVKVRSGSVIYYGREGKTPEEFVYLLDCLLRYQLVNANEQVRIRMHHRERSENFKSNFEKAKDRYCSSWGFESFREQEIKAISIDSLVHMVPNYSPDNIGWRDE